MFEVLETTRLVCEKSRCVKIDQQALERFAQKLIQEEAHLLPWDVHFHYVQKEEKTFAYLLVLDTINFCFWPADGKSRWRIIYDSRPLSGYYALAAALKRAFEKGFPLNKPDCLAQLSLPQLSEILAGRGELQLLEERVKNLNELGRVLLEKFNGKAECLSAAARGSAPRLARLLADNFSSFRDVSEYAGQKIFFYKRAQIFAADLYGAFKGQDWGALEKMEELTAFADYKLPQVLRHMGILHYREDLARKIDQKILLAPGSAEEVEIRANTVQAVEQIRQRLKQQNKEWRAFEIDNLLWNLGQNVVYRLKPYHRTKTIFY
jgi:hypothetical protein